MTKYYPFITIYLLKIHLGVDPQGDCHLSASVAPSRRGKIKGDKFKVIEVLSQLIKEPDMSIDLKGVERGSGIVTHENRSSS